MELTTADRLMLLGTLPREGDITTIRIVSDLRRDLSFTEDEHATLGLVFDDGAARWRQAADVPRAFDFGPKATALIVAELDRLNAAGKLTEQHLGLCEKFGIGG